MAWPYPTVQHLIACRRPHPVDAAYQEVVMRVVFGLRPPAGADYPLLLPELHVFAQVSGGSGTFELCVELYRMDIDPVLVDAALPDDVAFEDRVAAYSLIRQFQMIPFERAGLYEFRLFARLLRDSAGQVVRDQPRQLIQSEPLRMENPL